MADANVPCPKCSAATSVYGTERRPEGTLRRRLCGQCGHRFKTTQPPERPARFVSGYVPQ